MKHSGQGLGGTEGETEGQSETNNTDGVREVGTCNIDRDRVKGCIQIEMLIVTIALTSQIVDVDNGADGMGMR